MYRSFMVPCRFFRLRSGHLILSQLFICLFISSLTLPVNSSANATSFTSIRATLALPAIIRS